MNKTLTVRKLTKKYKNNEKVILSDFSLELNPREFLCILGPSGCGKTTLLRCIAGFEDYEGEVLIDGREVKKPDMDRILVFQNFDQLLPWKTVTGNIEYALRQKGGYNKGQRRKKAEEALIKVGLENSRDLYPYQLSGGMKQRVAIARALVLQPKVILMDEPFASLDAMTRRKLQNELLNKFQSENVSIIFITHNIQEALILGKRILVMSPDGTVCDSLMNDLQRPVTPETENYSSYWSRLLQALGQNKE